MEWLILIVGCLLGASVGGFLYVIIFRLPRGESPWVGRSRCPSCRSTLVWNDLIPVVSFLLLRGKCRYCQGKISWLYPTFELGGMMLFLVGCLVLLQTPAIQRLIR